MFSGKNYLKIKLWGYSKSNLAFIGLKILGNILVDDVSYAWKNYPLNTHFFGEKKVRACRQRLIAFGSGSCSYDWEVTNVSRTGGLEM
jgi:hypothetical protein